MRFFNRRIRHSPAIGVALAGLAFSMTSGCTSLPSIEDSQTVSLSTGVQWYGGLAVDFDPNPELRPGAMAMGAVEVAASCEYCFLIAIPMLPIALATGMAVTANETLPEDVALELNRVSSNVSTAFNFHAAVDDAMKREAAGQGIVLSSSTADVMLDIVMTELSWDVSTGNNVAIDATFVITGIVDGIEGCESVRYRSKRARVEDWTTDGGKPIHDTLTQFFDNASRKVWGKILDRKEAS